MSRQTTKSFALKRKAGIAASKAPAPVAVHPPVLTHIDPDSGAARMVEVGEKPVTLRRAVARGELQVLPETLAMLREGRVAKGDALAVARIAGIQAAKRTHEWIPLCHALSLTSVTVDFEYDLERMRIRVRAEARACDRTGVEMEALVAASAALLTLYDMIKAVDRGMVLGDICLVEKEGGRSGRWIRNPNE